MTKQKCFNQSNKEGAKSINLSNSYKIYCVKCPWFWFCLVFVPYATWPVFCSMDETGDVQLQPWFDISNSALKGKSLKNTFIEILENFK